MVNEISRCAERIPSGKRNDPATAKPIAVILLPAVLLKIIDRAQAWIACGNGRTEKN
jgi:hypothetical protein